MFVLGFNFGIIGVLIVVAFFLVCSVALCRHYLLFMVLLFVLLVDIGPMGWSLFVAMGVLLGLHFCLVFYFN